MTLQTPAVRRGALAVALAVMAAAAVLQHPGRRLMAQANPIAAENALAGNPATEWDVSGAGDSSLQGFATDISVTPGQTAQFKISTNASNYTIDIYRMGYYAGLGARKIATVAPIAPQTQPSCLTAPTTGLIDCGNWAVSASWPVPANAVSGIYFAKLTRGDTGGSSHIVFVVRESDTATQKSDILFQTSDTTWQAYNQYGGNSLYVGGPGTNPSRAYKVSYNRPFTTRGDAPEDWVFNAEYPMVRWLESNGYHVSYSTGVDSDRNGALIRSHKVFMAVGHDEYWSGNQRAQVEAARAAGVHLAFFTGNGTFWKTRWENSIDASNTPFRTLVSYKETHAGAVIDPQTPTWTGTWRDPRFSPPADGGRPENALMGTIFRVNDGTGGTGPILVPSAQGKHRFWRSTSVATLADGATATLPSGTLGYEWDEAPNDSFAPRGLMRLSTTTVAVGSMLLDYGSTYGSGTATHSLTLYRDVSGALVFGAGTMQWPWGLDSAHDRGSAAADLRMQQATLNLLADMGVQPATSQAGLVPQSASTDVTAPLSTIGSPAGGASIAAGTQVTISGTAADGGGGIVTGVEVSVDGGVTWALATGTTSWTFSWTASGSGSLAIRSRAYDDTGNLEVPSSGTLVTITAGRTCPCSIWDATAVPSPDDDNDPAAVTLGTKFRADSDGYITAIRFYKNSLNTGVHVGGLWTTTGILLSSVTFSGETASGWQQATLPSAVPISANTTYVVSYFAPNGHYSAPDSLFATAIDNPPLHGLQDGVDGANGVYVYGASHAFPTNTYLSEGYFVDVVFDTVPPPDTTPPTITSRFPASGATAVDPAASVTVTFSEAMNASTISSSTSGKEGTATTGTFELRDALNVLVTATVTYDATTRTATLRPTIALSLSTTYTVTVLGGATDPRVKDLAGNALAATANWSFTTAAAPPPPPTCPCTIWQPTDVPQKIDDGDPNSVELGTRFRSDVAGYITGARFYKGSLNTGTHEAKLWTNTGTLLGSATFVNETASGWQEVAFTTPVAINANTTYLISYHANNGHYSSASNYFAAAGVDNGPLHALRDGVDGANGVYLYGTSAFPTNTYQSEGYFVDVVFNTSIGPDTTPPVVASVKPAAGMSGVKTDASVTVTFNEAMDAATITSSSVLLRDPLGASVPATVTYTSGTKTATLAPASVLAYSTTYRIVVKGGTTDPRVKDVAGNALASDYTSSFTTAAPPPPPPDQGPGGPILVVTAASNPLTTYYAEILRTEGANAFATADISGVTAGTLAAYDVVILGEMPLTAAQVSMFTSWVTEGGNLIAMKPDKQLAGLLGLADAGTTLTNGYLLVNTASGPGVGIVNQTIQYHGTADQYTLAGATSIATLYASATAATPHPAVTTRLVGSGRAIAFTYPLGQSVVLTRQGNPAWAGQERDGFTPIRSNDLFFGNRAGDVQPDWVNLAKVAIPQADEQQRLLWNIILDANAAKKPLPRFWYLPRMLKAAVVMTGDDHANGGTVGRFDGYLSSSPPGCSVDDWTCIRGTSYLFPGTPISDLQAQSYVAQGFELALHVNTNCADWTTTTLPQFYSTQLAQFASQWPGVPAPTTNRTHCIVWSDYATQPQVELNNGIRFDTSYYYWPDTWVQDRPGMYTGSGMPMRFTTAAGQMIDVYQATSQLTDESGQTWPKNIDTLLDNALGPLGYYGVFTANMHTDFNPSAGSIGSDAIVASALARSVPVVSARQMLDWLDGRNASRFDNISYSGGVLSFGVAVGAGANGLRMLIPGSVGGSPVTGITLNGATVGFTTDTIKGVLYAIVPAGAGAYQVSYGADIVAPVISGRSAAAGFDSATIAWTTNEPADSRVEYSTDPAALLGSVTSTPLVTSHSLAITALAPNTTYYYVVRSADQAGNTSVSPSAENPPASFTTQAPSIAGSAGVDGAGATVTLSGAGSGTATADASGAFRFSGLANGTYTVTPAKQGYAFTPVNRSVTVSNADVTGVDFTAQAIVISGAITPAADGAGASLSLTGPVSRLVAADAGGVFTFSTVPDGTYTITPAKTGFSFTPASLSVTVAGASVTGLAFTAQAVPTWKILGAVAPAAAGSGTTLTVTGGATAVADGAGNYTLSGLVDGTYTVTPTKSGYNFTPASQSVTIAGSDVTAATFTASPVTLSGTITPAADGAGASLTLTGAATGTVIADAAGAYTFSALPNGTYTVTPAKAGYSFTPANRVITISGGGSVSGADFTATPVPIRTISGAIAPAASGSGTVLTLSSGATATADGSGSYTFTSLANGSYTVTPAKPGFTFSPASQAVTINGTDVTGVNFTAAPVTLSGTIGPLPGGAGVSVALSGGPGGVTTTDSAGTYTFSGLPNATYTVTPSKAGFSFSPASRSVTIAGGTSVAAIDFTASALPNTITIDATTSAGRNTRASSVTSPAFSTTSGNQLLLAFVGAANQTSTPTTVTSVTGAGLTWVLVRRTNVQRGTAEIWRAFAPAALTNVTVRADLSQSVVSQITVMSFKGTDISGTNGSGAIGATGSGNSLSGAPTASLVTTGAYSLVIGVGNDWDGATARTVGPNQTLVSQYLATDGDTFWVQRTTTTVPGVGTSVTINDTAPANHRYNLTICEIKAGA